MGKLIDITEQKFGHLLVLGFEYKRDPNRYYWKCQCDCGNTIITRVDSLRKRASCGCKNIRSLPYGESARNALYKAYKNSAKDRNIDFDLSIEEFYPLTKQNCYYCGQEPLQEYRVDYKNKKSNGNYIYNGVDRLDNNVGYVLDNCVPCCKICNYAKKNMSEEDFMEWIIRVYKYSGECWEK